MSIRKQGEGLIQWKIENGKLKIINRHCTLETRLSSWVNHAKRNSSPFSTRLSSWVSYAKLIFSPNGERICGRTTQPKVASPDSVFNKLTSLYRLYKTWKYIRKIEQTRAEGSIAKLFERGANPRQVRWGVNQHGV